MATRAALLLDLLALVPGNEDRLCVELHARTKDARQLVARALGLSADSLSTEAFRRRLQDAGVLRDDVIDPVAAEALADDLRLVIQLGDEALKRRLMPPNRLIMTATTDELWRLRRILGMRPLIQHVEDVIRDARQDLTIAAPYWNLAGLQRLRPAIEGALRREGGQLTLIAQGGRSQPTAVLSQLRTLVDRLRLDGLQGRLLIFELIAENGTEVFLHAKFALADSHLGYLGSANMTEQGFAANFELGVCLGPAEVAGLRELLTELIATGALQP